MSALAALEGPFLLCHARGAEKPRISGLAVPPCTSEETLLPGYAWKSTATELGPEGPESPNYYQALASWYAKWKQ